MAENFTFQQLFEAYKLNYTNELMTAEQSQNLRVWHERRGRTGITLSQADQWMRNAGLIKTKELTITGMTFAKFKQFSLSEEDFHDYIKHLSGNKKMLFEDFEAKLLAAGPPCEEALHIESNCESSCE